MRRGLAFCHRPPWRRFAAYAERVAERERLEVQARVIAGPDAVEPLRELWRDEAQRSTESTLPRLSDDRIAGYYISGLAVGTTATAAFEAADEKARAVRIIAEWSRIVGAPMNAGDAEALLEELGPS